MASIRRNIMFLRRLKPLFANYEGVSNLNRDRSIHLCRCLCTKDTTPPEEIKEPISTEEKKETLSTEEKKEQFSNEGNKETLSTEEKNETFSNEKNKETLSTEEKKEKSEILVRDPFLIFMRKDVQEILHRLRGFDPEKIFQLYKAKTSSKPRYTMMTDAELVKEKEEIIRKQSWMRLQMPPFMAERKPRDDILSDDSDIAPAIHTKYVFVDIAWKNKRIMGSGSRPIVCRHTDGKLRLADWDMVDRMSQMFDPVPGREVFMPKMFEEAHLEKLLEAENPDYRYMLERACVQFEPDSDDFIRVTRRIYENIGKRRKFEDLQSTRFYGPMVFYFCLVKSVAPLLKHLVQNDRHVDALLLVTLFGFINPDFKVNSLGKDTLKDFAKYAKKNSLEGWKTIAEVARTSRQRNKDGKERVNAKQ